VVIRYTLPYHAMSSREWNCEVMVGTAMPMIIVSKATKKVPSARDSVIIVSFQVPGSCSLSRVLDS
jgi:hypothetical protein